MGSLSENLGYGHKILTASGMSLLRRQNVTQGQPGSHGSSSACPFSEGEQGIVSVCGVLVSRHDHAINAPRPTNSRWDGMGRGGANAPPILGIFFVGHACGQRCVKKGANILLHKKESI